MCILTVPEMRISNIFTYTIYCGFMVYLHGITLYIVVVDLGVFCVLHCCIVCRLCFVRFYGKMNYRKDKKSPRSLDSLATVQAARTANENRRRAQRARRFRDDLAGRRLSPYLTTCGGICQEVLTMFRINPRIRCPLSTNRTRRRARYPGTTTTKFYSPNGQKGSNDEHIRMD